MNPTQKRGHGAKPDAVREQAILALLAERTLSQSLLPFRVERLGYLADAHPVLCFYTRGKHPTGTMPVSDRCRL